MQLVRTNNNTCVVLSDEHVHEFMTLLLKRLKKYVNKYVEITMAHLAIVLPPYCVGCKGTVPVVAKMIMLSKYN